MSLIKKYICKSEKTVTKTDDVERVSILLKMGPGLGQNKIFKLSSTGSKIWKFIENRSKVADVIKQFCNEIDVDYNEYQRDILKYIKRLIKIKVVDVFKTESGN